MSKGTLYGWFEAAADRHADAVALALGDESLSYRELRDLSERIAAALTAVAGGRPRAVGLCANRTLAAYGGYLAALRAGARVVPLDPDGPFERNLGICRSAGVDVALVDRDGTFADDLSPAAAPAVLRVSDGVAIPEERAEPQPTSPEDVAYVLFTSGSTGRPKGVPIRHRHLADYLPLCIDRYGVSPGARVAQTFDLTFDPSVFSMFVTWCAGGTLVVPEREEVLTADRFVVERGITHWFSVPSVISIAARLRALRPGAMPDLRWSLFAGERLTLEQARTWAAAAPASVLENLYGPTELTITCTSYRLQRSFDRWPATPNATVPIGTPYPHLEAEVAGEELCLRGSQRFDGYLDPSDNEGRFLRGEDLRPLASGESPEAEDWYRTGDRVRYHDGQLVFLGRLDDQVKVHGYRVELGEIEAVVREHPAVDDAVVVALESERGETQLCGLYCGSGRSDRQVGEHARRRLPAYMQPARWLYVDDFPVNANGKIDRGRLRRLAEETADPAVVQAGGSR
jgi:amino acid adenylation domain-containing protein